MKLELKLALGYVLLAALVVFLVGVSPAEAVGQEKVPAEVNMEFVQVDGSTGYYADTTVYNDGTIVVTKVPTVDFSTLADKVVEDSTDITRLYENADRSYQRRLAEIQKIQEQKTPDSLRRSYYSQYKQELRAVLQAIPSP